MSFPDITELSNAFTLCTCGDYCTRTCTVCQSVSWRHKPCVKQIWNEHTMSDEGKAAAKRFDDMVSSDDESTSTLIPLPEPYYVTLYSNPGKPVATVPVNPDGTVTYIVPPEPPPIPYFDEFPHSQRTDAIEKWIDYMDAEVGLEPWQANLIRWMLDGSPTRHR